MSRDGENIEHEDNGEREYQFKPSEIIEIRQRAATRLHEMLQGDGKDTITTTTDTANATTTTIGSVSCFEAHGFVRRSGFCTVRECRSMKDEMERSVYEEWDPNTMGLDSFGTDDEANVSRGDYFLESADRIHFFAEPTALRTVATTTTKTTTTTTTTTSSSSDTVVDGKEQLERQRRRRRRRQVLKPEYDGVHRIESLNKVGHALHVPTGTPFGAYVRSKKLSRLVRDELRWNDPVVPQSMYIFKQARTGGPVHSHQDSTFLYTTPQQTCLGLWLALDDATVENGCLWVRPGSHHEPVRRQYCRNPDHFGTDAIADRSNRARGDPSAPKFVMRTLVVPDDGDATKSSSPSPSQPTTTTTTTTNRSVPWDGKLPDNGWRGLFDAGFVPIECRAGDLLVFRGTLDHLSLPNFSDRARHTFQLHLIEGPGAGITWSPSNWLQYPHGKPFVKLG